jgi:transcriptional regulator with XRE-family HTH domain
MSDETEEQSELKPIFVECLRLAREHEGISQSELARRSNDHRSAITRRELNKSWLTEEAFQRAAAALGLRLIIEDSTGKEIIEVGFADGPGPAKVRSPARKRRRSKRGKAAS